MGRDANVSAAIASLEQFIEPRMDALAQLLAESPIVANLDLDDMIKDMPKGDERTFAEIGIMVVRRHALQKHGRISADGP